MIDITHLLIILRKWIHSVHHVARGLKGARTPQSPAHLAGFYSLCVPQTKVTVELLSLNFLKILPAYCCIFFLEPEAFTETAADWCRRDCGFSNLVTARQRSAVFS